MIKVHIRRKIYPQLEIEFDQLLSQLLARTIRMPGYIDHEILIDCFDDSVRLVCIRWVNVQCWQRWKSFSGRLEINQQISQFLVQPEKIMVYKEPAYSYKATKRIKK